MFLSSKVIAQYRESFLLMFSLTLFMKFLASSIVWLTCVSRYLFISLSERKVKISCSSLITNRLRVSLSVAKIGKGTKLLFNISVVFGLFESTVIIGLIDNDQVLPMVENLYSSARNCCLAF